MGEDFNQRHVIEVCPFRAWSLILNHTPDYDMVNAYNLGLMSLLVYKNEVMVDPDDEKVNMRDFINTPDTTTAFFYQQCFDLSKVPIMTDVHDYPAIVTDVPFKERYQLNAQRNTTFIALENALKNAAKQSTEKNNILKQALERYKEETHEI